MRSCGPKTPRVWYEERQIVTTDSNADPFSATVRVRFRVPSPRVAWRFTIFWRVQNGGPVASDLGFGTATWSLYPLQEAKVAEFRTRPVFESRSFGDDAWCESWEGQGPVRAHEAEIFLPSNITAYDAFVALEAQAADNMSDADWAELYQEIRLEAPAPVRIDVNGG